MRARSDATALACSRSRRCRTLASCSASSRARAVWVRITRPIAHGATPNTKNGKRMSSGVSTIPTTRIDPEVIASPALAATPSAWTPAEYA